MNKLTTIIDMRKMNMLFPAQITTKRLSSKTHALASQLEQQRALNAELLRVCEQQRRLLTQQSSMIEEILDGMGK